MSTLDSSSQTWLDKKLIPKLKISLEKSESEVNYCLSFSDVVLYLSKVFFLDLIFTGAKNSKAEEVSLVVKRSHNEASWYKGLRGDANFHNEILFYTKFAKNYEDYPRCFYAEENLPHDAVIVVENITKQGYHLHSQKVNLGIESSLPAIREIGKLHARAYILKEQCPKKFFEMINDIQPTVEKSCTSVNSFVDALASKGVDYLRKNKYDDIFCNKVGSFLKNAFDNVILDFTKPIEPLATLCHGDFTRNNVFFKETDVIQVKLIDFGKILYCSPAIDLSVFLWLSCSRINRTDQFSEVFDAYHETIFKCLKEAGVRNLERFSRDQLLEDFKRHALFGYIITTYFLPRMLNCVENPNGNLTVEEIIKNTSEAGGEEVSKILAEMLLDLRALGSLDHILQ